MEQTPKAEWLPAHIDYDGPARVSQYFDTRVRSTDSGDYVGFFRGRALVGRDLSLPAGYEAALVTTDGGALTRVGRIGRVRVWGADAASLDFAMQLTDVITVSDIIAADE